MLEVVAGVILDPTSGSGKILACQRPPGKSLAGKWEFPGGKIEPGETPQDALARELTEELGIQVQVDLSPAAALSPVIWDYGKGGSIIRLIPYLCCLTADSPAPIPAEHSAILWAGSEDIRTLDWGAADLPILEEIVAKGLLGR